MCSKFQVKISKGVATIDVWKNDPPRIGVLIGVPPPTICAGAFFFFVFFLFLRVGGACRHLNYLNCHRSMVDIEQCSYKKLRKFTWELNIFIFLALLNSLSRRSPFGLVTKAFCPAVWLGAYKLIINIRFSNKWVCLKWERTEGIFLKNYLSTPWWLTKTLVKTACL